MKYFYIVDKRDIQSVNGKEKIIMTTHKIITNDGYVVCECESLKEAAQCKAELIAIDKSDGTYEKGFYKIVRA